MGEFLFIILIVIAIFFVSGLRKLKDWERGVVFRLGKINRVVGPGIVFIIPFIERMVVFDTRVKTVKINMNNIFTKDNAKLEIESVVYYRIKDPAKYIYLQKPEEAIKNAFMSDIRDAIGELYLDEVFSNLDKLNDYVEERLRFFMFKYGIDIDTIKLTRVEPSRKISDALEAVKEAQQRLIAQKYLAEARKVLLKAIGEGAKYLDNTAVMYLYMQALKEIGKAPSSKMIMPMEFFGISSHEKDRSIEERIEKQLRGINVSQAIQTIKKVLEEEEKK